MKGGMMLAATLLLLFTMCAPVHAQQQDLAAAKELYVAAKYEEALAVLDQLKQAKPTLEAALGIEEYRAMCLLALDRKADAERAIEAVADLDPFFQPAEDDAAPWVRAAFRDARKKVLPSALQRLYGHAKDAYNKKQMAEAVIAFGRVLKILDDPDLALDAAARDDMKMVAEGFRDLAQAAVNPPPPVAAPAPAPPVGTPAPGAPGAAPPATAAAAPPEKRADKPEAGAGADTATIHDVTSKDVVPPLPIRRDVPSWAFGPRPAAGTAVVVEVVVRETGSIESVVVRQSAGKYYDEMVAQAARNWLYKPALKAGEPVKYRLLVKVVIGRPSEPPSSGD